MIDRKLFARKFTPFKRNHFFGKIISCKRLNISKGWQKGKYYLHLNQFYFTECHT